MKPLDPTAILALQQGVLYLVAGCGVWWYVLPWLRSKPQRVAISILLVPFLFRFVGAANMVPGVVGPDYPLDSAWVVVIGDVACTLLALFALAAYRFDWRFAPISGWVVALQSALYSAYYAASSDIPTIVANLHAHWYVGAMFVPILLVSTGLLFLFLIRPNPAAPSGARPRIGAV